MDQKPQKQERMGRKFIHKISFYQQLGFTPTRHLPQSCLRKCFKIMDIKKSSFKCTRNNNSSKLIHHNNSVQGENFKRNGEGKKKENDSLHIIFLRACWFQNILSCIKKLRVAPLFTAAGHSALDKSIGFQAGFVVWNALLIQSPPILSLLICIQYSYD